ncbi:ABC transporter permease [Nocardioides pocheonensis]|uniref:ABC transporter permease n=1 Tax=Nocardioides pocheonensis TaxID=661485 RepID=UPI00161FEFE2|nr:ABC transporter permease subunit [Nocardioides pocheonensis]
MLDVLPREDFPPVTAILQALVSDLQTSELWAAVGASMEAWVLGMLVVVSIGVPVGMLLGASSISYRMSYLTLEFVRTIPGIAALPILLFIYGIGQDLTVSFVVLAALWPLLIQAMYGMRDVDPVAIETAKVYGVGHIRRVLLVDLPSCLPYLSTGLRLSGTFALIFAIATSLIVGGEGLGAEMARAAVVGDRPLLYARVLLTGLIGLVVALGLTTLERRTLRWHVSQRGAQS